MSQIMAMADERPLVESASEFGAHAKADTPVAEIKVELAPGIGHIVPGHRVREIGRVDE